MGLFGNAEAKAQKRADRRAARTERVAKRREFLGGVINTAAGTAALFAPSGGGGEEPGTRSATGTEETEKPGLPKWLVPAAIGGVLLFMFMNKKGRR